MILTNIHDTKKMKNIINIIALSCNYNLVEFTLSIRNIHTHTHIT